MSKKQTAPVIIWLFTGCFLIFSMVLIGGITRLTHSGLSIVEWKFTGSLPPLNENEWQVEFSKYKTSPEFQKINTHFTVSDFKNIFWWEYIHRMLGRTIGIVFILPLLWFQYRKLLPPGFLKNAGILLMLGFCQGLLGWIMVKSGLNKVPHVSHYLLASHLTLAFITFGFTFWYALNLLYAERKSDRLNSIRKHAMILLGLVAVQIIYGAFVAGMQAGALCPTWPKMGNDWLPAEVYSMSPMWNNFLENPYGVQFIHRIIAIIILIFAIALFMKKKNLAISSQQRLLINLVIAGVAIQIALGIATLIFHVPLIVASLHQVGAFFLFSLIITLIHRTR